MSICYEYALMSSRRWGEYELARNIGETHIKDLVEIMSNAYEEEERAQYIGILCYLPKNLIVVLKIHFWKQVIWVQ